MENFTQGNAPGLDTSSEKAPGVSQDSKGLKTNIYDTDFRTDSASNQAHRDIASESKLIAAYARIKGALTGFYLDRAIGVDTIAMLILMAVFAAVRGLA